MSKDAGDQEGVVARLAEEMVECWRKGIYHPAEHFLDSQPGLCDCPAAVMDLLYEEICLCREHGRPVEAEQLFRRFPGFVQKIEILLNCVQALEGPAASSFPEVGETFGDFHLVARLGRGGQGVVFAATQSSLGDRPVVLKISSRRGDEHLSLARLQHTHIVPLLSSVDDAGRNLRLLCMPYFGGLTLAAILSELHIRPPDQRSGRHILDCLERTRAADPIALPAGCDPATPFLERASYVEVVTWLGACLAEALKYAHERGLVHLDLKPSNVLLTADRQPMLLDFHLAREPVEAGDPGVRFGGTPTYMSPEQRRAMAAIKAGRTVPDAIAGRSDIYSLGLVLHEALGGMLPDEDRPVLPPCHTNARVSPGLSDIIVKCLAPLPENRYQDAGALAADLWAHLNDLPLKGVSNRSIAERWRKLRRRKPHLVSLVGMFGAVLVLAGTAVVIASVHLGHRAAEARTALAEGDKLVKAGRHAEGIAALTRGLSQLENLPGNKELKRQLLDGLQSAAHSQAAHELHEIAERFRFLYGVDFMPSAQLQTLEARCRRLWDTRDRILERLRKEPGIEKRVRLDLLDLAVLGADLRVRLAGKTLLTAARQGALQTLSQAEAIFGPNAVLFHERRLHAEALGLAAVVREVERRAAEFPPQTIWEHYALGRSLLHENRLDAAASHFRQALALQPNGLWPSFYHGVCCYRLGKYEDAALSFTTCTSLAPQVAGCFHNRGLALVGLKRDDLALADFDQALKLDPGFAEAAHNRGLLHLRAKRLSDAAADFEQALTQGANPARGHFQLAVVRLAQNDRNGALSHLERAKRLDPSHAEAAKLIKKLHAQPQRTVPNGRGFSPKK